MHAIIHGKVIRLSPEYSMKNVSSANGIHASEILSQPLDCHHLVDAISLSLNFEAFSAGTLWASFHSNNSQ